MQAYSSGTQVSICFSWTFRVRLEAFKRLKIGTRWLVALAIAGALLSSLTLSGTLSALMGQTSEFSRKFRAEPFGASIRVKSELIAPETWEKTILPASNGLALQASSESWP